RYAADKGYDRIAWTTGDTQVNRYHPPNEGQFGGFDTQEQFDRFQKGMQNFYDKYLSEQALKLGKQHGAVPQDINLSTGEATSEQWMSEENRAEPALPSG